MGVSTVQLVASMETIVKIERERLNTLRGYSTIVEKNSVWIWKYRYIDQEEQM